MYLKRNKELGIIMLYLNDYKKQFYLREISRLTKTPLKTTQNKIKELEQKNILIGSQEGKNKYFKLNLSNIQTKFYLLQAEIYKTFLFLEKYPVFKTFLKEIKTLTPLIIFGSFARFKADKNSDLDLLKISMNELKLPLHLLPYELHKIDMTEATFIKSLSQQETIIKEIEENHVILNNHSFYVDNMWSYYAG
ncbi:MAG: nucleotidyltransferase domain-containing protein [Nanoarchaeota archaeon]|nr:nucleotidyltransferase domain-containing protein [Nanoarchaeota archaeon]MBU1322252.1 nucleotidyltransferase domain-containing protein [Nanoarchaeota archaeon]MBU1598232.1 nucleotidyltransferase domain-containing protein [Nanoarchaeota archaeon]MBU2441985.1 nucleotidyltransferase domain-containing protein [Nanoarchaeota archaeon]